jgi:hypothetical protein
VFPLLLLQYAAAKYPKACTIDEPEVEEDGELADGTPGYVLLKPLV